MLTLIKGGEVYLPEFTGNLDILLAGEQIVHLAPKIKETPEFAPVKTIDASELLVVPGFLDQHVHITGGGGEAGPSSRTPEIKLSHLTTGGVTTVVGLLGVDGVTRSVAELLAKARALEEEGITSYIYTGAYELPTRTLTGKVRSDIVLIDKIIGTGEIAISDHRSDQPSWQELARLAAEARTGGLLGGKAGVVHLHVGEGKEGLNPILKVLENTEIPKTQLVPTHINRIETLFEQAMEFLQSGGYIDLTAGITRENEDPTSIPLSEAIKKLVDKNLPLERVTASSDGNGSMPNFDRHGRLIDIGVSPPQVLWSDLRDTIIKEGIPLSTVLPLVTTNVARLLKLPHKGRIALGNAADLVLLNKDLTINKVIAKGKLLVDEGKAIIKGKFED